MKKFNDEVYYSDQKIVRISSDDIDKLKKLAEENIRKRVRLCTHEDIADKIHEMMIVHTKDAYVRPHKHLNKSESFYIVEGDAFAVLFEEDGAVKKVIKLGDYQSGKKFYCRISENCYHSLIIISDVIVFHEVTSGPFNKADTVFSPWSPDENNTNDVKKFISELNRLFVEKN